MAHDRSELRKIRSHALAPGTRATTDPPLHVSELETPAALIDAAILQRNIDTVAQLAKRYDVRLRPHAKTHKSPHVAALQLAAGAVGITVAKLAEAEVFTEADIDDVFVCYPLVNETSIERLLSLAERARVSTIVETAAGARLLAAGAAQREQTIDVFIDVDLGLGRVGVAPGKPLQDLYRRVKELKHLRINGLSTHEGFVYSLADPYERRCRARAAIEQLVASASSLGLEHVSCGATPALRDVVDVPGLTELRPGNYVFYDAMQIALGVAEETDCALTILSTIVSVRSPERAIIDAGSKTLSSDRGAHGFDSVRGFGTVVGRPQILISSLSEEHGWLKADQPPSEFRIGERIRVIPNHACTTIANFDHAYLIEEDFVLERIPISARGALT